MAGFLLWLAIAGWLLSSSVRRYQPATITSHMQTRSLPLPKGIEELRALAASDSDERALTEQILALHREESFCAPDATVTVWRRMPTERVWRRLRLGWPVTTAWLSDLYWVRADERGRDVRVAVRPLTGQAGVRVEEWCLWWIVESVSGELNAGVSLLGVCCAGVTGLAMVLVALPIWRLARRRFGFGPWGVRATCAVLGVALLFPRWTNSRADVRVAGASMGAGAVVRIADVQLFLDGPTPDADLARALVGLAEAAPIHEPVYGGGTPLEGVEVSVSSPVAFGGTALLVPFSQAASFANWSLGLREYQLRGSTPPHPAMPLRRDGWRSVNRGGSEHVLMAPVREGAMVRRGLVVGLEDTVSLAALALVSLVVLVRGPFWLLAARDCLRVKRKACVGCGYDLTGQLACGRRPGTTA